MHAVCMELVACTSKCHECFKIWELNPDRFRDSTKILQMLCLYVTVLLKADRNFCFVGQV